MLKGLEDVIGLSVVDPIRDERGWAFTGGEYTDPVNGFRFLGEAYAATDTAHKGRLSVPVLWDTETKRIVNNESADVLRMYTTAFDRLATREIDLWPEPHRDAIDALNTRLYDDVNNAVYAAGFSRDQADYEQIVRTHVRDARRDGRAPRRRAGSCSATPRSRPTGACSPRCCASTPSTTSTSSAACAGSSTTRTCGRTRATSTSGPASPARCASTTSAATTT